MAERFRLEIDLNEDLEEARELLRSELSAIGAEMKAKIIDILEREGKRATGDVIASVEEEVRETLTGFELAVGAFDEGAVFVDEGLRPGKMRPLKPLREWANVKFGDENIAYAAREKIFRGGVEPVNFIRETFDLFIPTLSERIAAKFVQGFE